MISSGARSGQDFEKNRLAGVGGQAGVSDFVRMGHV